MSGSQCSGSGFLVCMTYLGPLGESGIYSTTLASGLDAMSSRSLEGVSEQPGSSLCNSWSDERGFESGLHP